MKFKVLVCSCLLLQVTTVRSSSEEIWKWSSSSPAIVSSTETTTTETANSVQYRYAGLSTAQIVESDDSYHVSAVSGRLPLELLQFEKLI
jgi:hypothetical protein